MINLVLSILLIVLLFTIFRVFPKYKIHTLEAIIVNYLTCTLIGLFFISNPENLITNPKPWYLYTCLLGCLFIFTFNLIGYSIQKSGMTVTGVANKMSMIIPITISLIFIKPEQFTLLQGIGFTTALISIYFCSVKAEESTKKINFLLPLIVFIAGGIIDSSVNLINFYFISSGDEAVFTLLVFAAASTIGLIILLTRAFLWNQRIQGKNIIAGILLGIPNYFSVFFLLKTLSDFDHNGALVFSVMNISVIVLTSLTSVVLFREKLSSLNIAGIFIAVASILILYIDRSYGFVF